MEKKTKETIELIDYLMKDKTGKKILIAGGIILGLYASTYIMNGTTKFIYSFKKLRSAIRS